MNIASSDWRRWTHVRPGAVLLEVIAALTLFAIAGVALLELALQMDHAVTQVEVSSKEVRAANAFLESVALWTRADLDRHLGRRAEGRFELVVERSSPTLYHVILSRANASSPVAILETPLSRTSMTYLRLRGSCLL